MIILLYVLCYTLAAMGLCSWMFRLGLRHMLKRK